MSMRKKLIQSVELNGTCRFTSSLQGCPTLHHSEMNGHFCHFRLRYLITESEKPSRGSGMAETVRSLEGDDEDSHEGKKERSEERTTDNPVERSLGTMINWRTRQEVQSEVQALSEMNGRFSHFRLHNPFLQGPYWPHV